MLLKTVDDSAKKLSMAVHWVCCLSRIQYCDSAHFLTCSVAGFDYISVGYELEFVASGQPIQCVQIQLVDDRLAEAEEWFGTQLSADLYSVDVVDIQLLLWIEPSDGR